MGNASHNKVYVQWREAGGGERAGKKSICVPYSWEYAILTTGKMWCVQCTQIYISVSVHLLNVSWIGPSKPGPRRPNEPKNKKPTRMNIWTSFSMNLNFRLKTCSNCLENHCIFWPKAKRAWQTHTHNISSYTDRTWSMNFRVYKQRCILHNKTNMTITEFYALMYMHV